MGYSKTLDMRIFRIKHEVDFQEGLTSADELRATLKRVSKDAIVRKVFIDEDGEVTIEFLEEQTEEK